MPGGRTEVAEGNEVILPRTDLVYRSFHNLHFGKGSKHNVNPSK